MQQVNGLHPITTIKSAIALFAAMGSAMVVVGSILLWFTCQQVTVQQRYDRLGPTGGLGDAESAAFLLKAGTVVTNVDLVITRDMAAPVHVYYRLDDFFQNHKRYVRSHDYAQIHGATVASSLLDKCAPQKVLRTKGLNASELAQVKDDGLINPCGLGAWSYFNDTFDDFRVLGAAGEALFVNSSELVWESDRSSLYGRYLPQNLNTVARLKGGGEVQGFVNEDEHFMVWMKYSVRPSIRKYWGRIDKDLTKGETVRVTVANSFNTYGYGGKKWLILSTSNKLGGRNPTLGIVWLVGGSVWIAAAVIFILLGNQRGLLNRDPDTDKVQWLMGRLSWASQKKLGLVE